MPDSRRLPTLVRLRSALTRRAVSYGLEAFYTTRNLLSRDSVLGDAPVVVSLTSHGARLRSVHLAIESIGSGKVRPRRLILWLSEPPDGAGSTLRRLQRRGLEIRTAPDLGPHKKYYPYAASLRRHHLPLVTADDDAYYSRDWLRGLLRAYGRRPDVITCYRAHVMAWSDGTLVPYRSWPMCTDGEPSHRNFATGVSGVIYPPHFLETLRAHGTTFLASCPWADDVWLHAMAVRTRTPVAQVGNVPREFPGIMAAEKHALFTSVNAGAANDAQIAATYSADDLVTIGEES